MVTSATQGGDLNEERGGWGERGGGRERGEIKEGEVGRECVYRDNCVWKGRWEGGGREDVCELEDRKNNCEFKDKQA